MPMTMGELERACRGDSRRDLLRKIQSLIVRAEAAEQHADHVDRVIMQQNFHLEHAETLIKDHVSRKRTLKKEHWERAVGLAHPEVLSEHPDVCPDCGGEIRHAAPGWYVCDAGCGFRYRSAEPRPIVEE